MENHAAATKNSKCFLRSLNAKPYGQLDMPSLRTCALHTACHGLRKNFANGSETILRKAIFYLDNEVHLS